MKKIISLVMLVAAIAMLVSCKDDNGEINLKCHVGGTMQPVMVELGKLYKEKTGINIEINSAGSGELLAHIELMKKGDLYICHDPFLDILMRKKLGIDGYTVGELQPIILVQKGNPKNIKGLKDLQRDDIEVALTDYKYSSLGRMLPTIFEKAGIDFDEYNKKKRIITNKSGSFVGNLVKMKNADAGIVWKAVAVLRADDTDYIEIDKYLPIPNIDSISSATGKFYNLTPMRVTIANLKCSENKKEAEKFMEFLVSKEAGKIFDEYGIIRKNKNIIKKEYFNGIQIK